MKIFIIEDNQKLGIEISNLLKKYGYDVDVVIDFQNIMNEYKESKADLILLDINLPYFDGYHFCRQIRDISDIPIIFITSRDNSADEIMALTFGGDDYITKPFDNQVLLTRIAAVLKRYHKNNSLANELIVGGLQLNLGSNEICYKEQTTDLSKNEGKLLAMLMQNKGNILSRTKLIEMLWNNDEFVDENTLSVNINRIRGKLTMINCPNIITTVRGEGYVIK